MNLIQAVESKKGKLVEQLIKEGAELDIVDEENRTPLYWAAKIGSPKMVKMIVEI